MARSSVIVQGRELSYRPVIADGSCFGDRELSVNDTGEGVVGFRVTDADATGLYASPVAFRTTGSCARAAPNYTPTA
jgi:hypothetical protein